MENKKYAERKVTLTIPTQKVIFYHVASTEKFVNILN